MKFVTSGLTDDQMEAILEEHNSDIETLEARHLQTYQQQDENLKVYIVCYYNAMVSSI